MALVKFSTPVDEIAGSIGGVTFQRNAIGAIARLRTKPVAPASPASARTTSILSTFTWDWSNSLTQVERDAWDTAAAATTWVNTLGQNYSPTGLNAYVRSQIAANSALFSPNNQAPTVLTEPDPVLVFTYTAPTAIRVTSFGTASSPPNGRITIDVSDAQRPTIQSFNGPYPNVAFADLGSLPATPWTFFNLPNPHPDVRVFIRYRVFIVDNISPNPPWERGRCMQPAFNNVFALSFP